MGSIEPIKCFLYIPSSEQQKTGEVREGTLSYVTENGTIISVKCKVGNKKDLKKHDQPPLQICHRISIEKSKEAIGIEVEKMSPDVSKIFSLTGRMKPVKVFLYEQEETFTQDRAKASEVNKTAFLAPSCRIAVSKKWEERFTKVGARTFHLITGILATPAAMVTGLGRLTLVAARALAFLGVKGVRAIIRGRIKKLDIAVEVTRGFLSSAPTQVRIALLELIPVIGSQLANQYKKTGSVKGFRDAPAIGRLLGKMGLNVAQVVYGTKWRNSLKLGSARVKRYWDWFSSLDLSKDKNYLCLEKPSLDDAKKVVEASCKEDGQPVLVRIPVVREGKETRYHDGTLLFAKSSGNPSMKAPTVILYHGNGGHRDVLLGKAQFYLEAGWNVLLASYAGDCAIQGDGKEYKEVPTPCTEAAMREDARADVAFLQALGVQSLGIYGHSLGGAQAMNCAQAVGPEGPKVDFIELNKTFTNAIDVVGRVAKNATKSSVLARVALSFARRFFHEEEKKKDVIFSIMNTSFRK